MKTINYSKKIKYLLISFEALRMQNWKYNTIENNNILVDYKYLDQNIYSLIAFINSIQDNNSTYEFIKLILKQSILLEKYIKKFEYIHNQTLQYYHVTNLHDRLNINNIAITNLYTIYKFLKNNNILYLLF